MSIRDTNLSVYVTNTYFYREIVTIVIRLKGCGCLIGSVTQTNGSAKQAIRFRCGE